MVENRNFCPSCELCAAACCQGVILISLSIEERTALDPQGTLLEMVEEPFDLIDKREPKFRFRNGQCPNLDVEKNECKDYDNRPRACRLFVIGGEACKRVFTPR